MDETTAGVGEESQPSSQQQPQSSSPDFASIAARLERMEQQLRSAQSNKDKAVAQTNKRLNQYGEVAERMAQYLERFNNDHRLAAREMQIDDLLAAQQEGSSDTNVQPQAREDEGSEVDGVTLTALGFDPNAPEIVALLARGAGLNDFVNLARQRVQSKQQTNPQPSTITSLSEGAPSPAPKAQDALKAEYDKRRNQMYESGQLTPVSLADLQIEMRKKGLNI